MSKPDRKDAKSINVSQVVSYLNHSFAKTAEEMFGRAAAVKGSKLYDFQVNHCYLIDTIQRGPTYMLPKVISNANDNVAAMKTWGEEQKGK